ncbi:hypothetical protein PYCCODRAFT_1441219 [Trametes coccinea BRFM310]|uniref:Uncharacterized protein n=1 Tax=Trametes coccinea (strain BRFM310) TaxID=1353009 RepID=A0A1Y2J487_TRAC3|nr:hypothetical protein PYCCODRAFT_1441219 [Trametes coccinea BRFM310]
MDLYGGFNEEFNFHQNDQNVVHGLRALREAVKRDLDSLEKGTSAAAMPSGVKVDVVAADVNMWIRVNTYSDDTIIRMGRSLLYAARPNLLPGDAPLDPQEYDARIAQTTFKWLRDTGIDVELGEPGDLQQVPQLSPVSERRLEPTLHINLDLSLFIVLISAEAEARYVPPAQYREWKRKHLEAGAFDGIGKHSRALAKQALQEMTCGLLQELRDRMTAVSSSSLEDVEFWTTPEARDRCLRIVLSKFGSPQEKRRTAALFVATDEPLVDAEKTYWEGSRYSHAFLPPIPIPVFESSTPPFDLKTHQCAPIRALLSSPFFPLLARTCRNMCAKKRRRLTKANPRTTHTVRSLLWGAAHRWTTLTANQSSVKAILRNISTAESGYEAVEQEQGRR